MEPDIQRDTTRFRIYNWFGLVLGVLLVITGILAIVFDSMAFGWGFVAGGLVAVAAAVYQLTRSTGPRP